MGFRFKGYRGCVQLCQPRPPPPPLNPGPEPKRAGLCHWVTFTSCPLLVQTSSPKLLEHEAHFLGSVGVDIDPKPKVLNPKPLNP